MTRIDAFIDFDNTKNEDFAYIIDTTGKTVQLWRRPITNNAGFSEEVGVPEYKNTIKGLFWNEKEVKDVSELKLGKAAKETWIFITMYKIILLGDVLKFNNESFLVVSVNNVERQVTQVKIERLT